MASAHPEEIAHVIAADIVAYSLKPIEEQIRCLEQFESLIDEAIAKTESQPLRVETGDGAWLLFSRFAHTCPVCR